jgi:hypothetical protein
MIDQRLLPKPSSKDAARVIAAFEKEHGETPLCIAAWRAADGSIALAAYNCVPDGIPAGLAPNMAPVSVASCWYVEDIIHPNTVYDRVMRLAAGGNHKPRSGYQF